MKLLAKIAAVVVILAGFAWLFVRTAQDARSEAYVVSRQHLQGWTLAIEPAADTSSPLLVARPPQELSAGLFQQMFARMMESMHGSTAANVPLILRGEYELSLAGSLTPDALLELARAAGLDRDAFAPNCVAVKRISQPGLTRQLYYVLFDSPAFGRFRDQVARATKPSAAAVAFDPVALAPIMIVGASDAAFDSWLPIGPGASDNCIAPLDVN